jgi:hypothetical protein
VANGVPRLELSGIVTDEGVIFTSGSGAGLHPEHIAMHINASNVPASCFTLRSSQTGDDPHFRSARVFHTSVNTARRPMARPRDYSGPLMMNVDQAAEAMKHAKIEAEIEDFLESFNQPTYRGMRINGV